LHCTVSFFGKTVNDVGDIFPIAKQPAIVDKCFCHNQLSKHAKGANADCIFTNNNKVRVSSTLHPTNFFVGNNIQNDSITMCFWAFIDHHI
jgi:hypothetical protein